MVATSRRRHGPGFAGPLAAAALALLLLGGCTVGPDFNPPAAPASDAYLGAGEGKAEGGGTDGKQLLALGQRVSGAWWDLFASPELDEVLRQAIAGNRDLAAARASLAQAAEAVLQASGAALPQIDFAAAAERQKLSFASSGLKTPSPVFNFYSAGPNLSYALDLFGGTRRLVEQQGAIAEFQGYQLAAAYLSLTGDAVAQAIAIAAARAQIKVTHDIIADDERNLDLVRRELAAGIVTQLDIEAATSQLESDRALLPPLEQQLSLARHALATLLGKPPADWAPPDFELAALRLPSDVPVSLPSELVRQRPDVLAAEAQLHAASAGIGVATAQLYPNITLSAGLGQQALAAGALFKGASNVWDIAAGLTAPLFHGGSLAAQRRGAIDAFDAALAAYQQTVLRSFAQVADLLTALQHDAQAIAAQQRALDATQASVELTRKAYGLGSVGIVQILDAERLYAQAALGHVRAVAQRHLDTAQLLVAMGGGWWDAPAAAMAPSVAVGGAPP
ncbi:MAG: efflux transporter outer membrane subunit [Alphaproteobacteria bacterium]|nr:efflux transporter outer membrane subunit [Alphaproteobacteria bacterium]